MLEAKIGKLSGACLAKVKAADNHLTSRWAIQTTDQVQRGCLAASGRAGQNRKFALIKGEGQICQGMNLLAAQRVDLRDVFQFNQRHKFCGAWRVAGSGKSLFLTSRHALLATRIRG